MNVLSLFDGMSCGQIALNRLGIKYDKYYAAEIDKYSISVTMNNYPNTIQLGDVCNIKSSDLPKIDLIMGGSPCQSFSTAGDGTGFNGKSGLFWEYQDNIYRYDGIMGCLIVSRNGAASYFTKTYLPNGELRRLTENEVEKLQGIPIDYTKCVSSSRRYEMIGNGWTIDVIAHILKQIK